MGRSKSQNFFHRALKLFLSVYVDDLKMSGLKENLAAMWKVLGDPETGMDIDPPKRRVDKQYLGCSQHELVPAEVDIERMGAAFDHLSVKRGDDSAEVARQEKPTTKQVGDKLIYLYI